MRRALAIGLLAAALAAGGVVIFRHALVVALMSEGPPPLDHMDAAMRIAPTWGGPS